jgi:hypothetical protein
MYPRRISATIGGAFRNLPRFPKFSGFRKMRARRLTASESARHGRACPGHPRLVRKTWMPGTRPGMTIERGESDRKNISRQMFGFASEFHGESPTKKAPLAPCSVQRQFVLMLTNLATTGAERQSISML